MKQLNSEDYNLAMEFIETFRCHEVSIENLQEENPNLLDKLNKFVSLTEDPSIPKFLVWLNENQ